MNNHISYRASLLLISYRASLLLIAIGFLVLLGWQFDFSLLKSRLPGMASTMKRAMAELNP